MCSKYWLDANELGSDGIELAANSNKYARNIGPNEFDEDRDGIELAANSSERARNIRIIERGKKHVIGSYSKLRIYWHRTNLNECNNDRIENWKANRLLFKKEFQISNNERTGNYSWKVSRNISIELKPIPGYYNSRFTAAVLASGGNKVGARRLDR